MRVRIVIVPWIVPPDLINTQDVFRSSQQDSVVSPSGHVASYSGISSDEQPIPTPPGLQRPPPEPFLPSNTPRISCCDRGNEGGLGEAEDPTLLQCGLCNTPYHRRCIELDYGKVDLAVGPRDFWLCPSCSPKPMNRWNDA